jgi:SAM-dependent methyltransferase
VRGGSASKNLQDGELGNGEKWTHEETADTDVTRRDPYPAPIQPSTEAERVRGADQDPFSPAAVAGAYDIVAEDYAATFGDDLPRLPVDRAILDAAADRIGTGIVLDVGCGPGQVSRYLADRGLDLVGLDLARRMLALPDHGATTGRLCADMRRIPLRSASCQGAFAFYSLQHLPRYELPPVLAELRRALRPGGVLVIATHLGRGEVHLTEFLGHGVPEFAGTLHDERELEQALLARSFDIVERHRRDPSPHEYPSERLYLLAVRRNETLGGANDAAG